MADAGDRRLIQSLELRLPLLISALLVLVIGGFSWAAYGDVRRSTLGAATERLERVTRQLADLLGAGAPQRAEDVRQAAADPGLPAYASLQKPFNPDALAHQVRAALRTS